MHEHDTYISDLEPKPARRKRLSFAWPALFLAAWVLYELTHQPALAVIALCTKFGWEDFRTARWLRRKDARRGRAWANYFLYMAGGLWKMAITATLMIFAYVLLVLVNRAVGGQGLDLRAIGLQVVGAALVILGGVCFSTLSVWLAIGLAIRCGCKLWLHGNVHADRREQRWPPPDPNPPKGNLLGMLVLTTLIAAGGPALMILLALTVGKLGGRPNQAAVIFPLVMGCMVGSMVLAALAARWLLDLVARKVLASRPSECWNRSAGDTAPRTEVVHASAWRHEPVS